MGNQTELAEHATGLCVGALGIALTGGGLAAIAVPLAVLGTIGTSRWLSCDGATLKQAQKAALDALRADRSITPDEIDRTTDLLRENRRSITFQPAKLAAAVANRTLPQTLIDAAFGSTIAFESPGVQRAATLTLTAAFDIARHSDRYQGAFTQDLVLELLQGQGALATTVAEMQAQVAELVAMIREERAQRPAAPAVPEALLVALAYEYAPGSTGDLPSAYAGLRQALAEAAEMKARAALPQNTGDAVQAVLRRVAELNERGQLDAGQSELDDALARMQAQRATLLDQSAAQARLRNDPATAARHMVDRLRIDVPEDLFNALRALRHHHYDIGLQQGIGFDLVLSIDFARHSHRVASTDVERATALNDLAIALQVRGTRTGGAAGAGLLAEAIVAHRQALQVATRADHPLDWAIAMQNLASTLDEQGARMGGAAGTGLLAEAVAAYRQALEVTTRVDHPLDWAIAKQNLALTLRRQGIRTGGAAGTALIAEAVAACRQALQVRTRVDHQLDWALTIQNLALALLSQGIRTYGAAGTTLLAEAVAAYRQALEVSTRADHPVQWATTMQNLAIALQEQGTRTGGEAGTAPLAQAVAAYGQALQVFTRADHPVQWAMTQENMAICEQAWSQHPACDGPLPHLRAALEHVEAALTVYDPVHMPYDHGTATALRAKILVALSPDG